MAFRALLVFWLLAGSACSAGLMGSSAVGGSPSEVSNEISNTSPTTTKSSPDDSSDTLAAAPIPASLPLTGGTAPGTPTNASSYYMLPGNSPRIASAGGGSGVLSAPTDDDKVHVNCNHLAYLEEVKDPPEEIVSHNETPWNILEGKTLRRKLLVLRKGDAEPEDLQVRVYRASPDEQRVVYRDYVFAQLGAQGQELEIEIENPQFGEIVKVFYSAPKPSADPLDRVSKNCAQYRFDGLESKWTPAPYEEYAQGPLSRVYVNQMGSFPIQVIPSKHPGIPGIPLFKK
ncbi:MAG: hypothetical protein K8R69_11555 [Deltaproteobacteria bacterium]|nr:hypothetical protein [Deltaproteobacteria bacterium]